VDFTIANQPHGKCAVTAEKPKKKDKKMAERDSLTGLSDAEAREFHGFFMTSFIAFTVIAIIAHFLVWQWRPWFPGVKGYAAISDGLTSPIATLVSLIS
jgi:light-harvesting complex 1 beta chain